MRNRTRTTEAGKPADVGAGRDPVPDETSDARAGQQAPHGAARAAGTEPGQLALDDRGNISWQWADDPELLTDDRVGNTARLRALAPRDLELADEDVTAVNRDLASQKGQPIPVRKTQRTGYNPYDSGEPTRQAWKKKRDLRELGKWLELKKRMRNKSDEG